MNTTKPDPQAQDIWDGFAEWGSTPQIVTIVPAHGQVSPVDPVLWPVFMAGHKPTPQDDRH